MRSGTSLVPPHTWKLLGKSPETFGPPPTVPWGSGNSTPIDSYTQKYWVGSSSRFNGECSQRQESISYDDHIAIVNITTPVPFINPSPCAQGQFAN
jgi:hypothetical protein